MINQRKRVAKRLASGLLAGALALGGLAISGSGPAGAAPIELDSDFRIAGDDRYATSANVAEVLEDELGVDIETVIVASGENYPDALAASTLAGDDTAILLVRPDSIPSSVRDRMFRLADSVLDVIIVGGEAAVSAAVEEELTDIFDNADIDRISGDNRYATAVAIADEVGLDAGTVAIVSGESFADALSIGPWAGTTGFPILLANAAGIPAETEAALETALDEGSTRVVIVGGTSAVGSIEDALVELGFESSDVVRVAGPDRYVTNLLWQLENIASVVGQGPNKYLTDDEGLELAGHTAMIVSGETFADALSASPLAAHEGAHLILASATGGASALALAAFSGSLGSLSYATSIGDAALAANNTGSVTASLIDGATSATGASANYTLKNLWVVGGTARIPDSLISTMNAAADSKVGCSILVAGGNEDSGNANQEGPRSFIISFAGNLSNASATGGGTAEFEYLTNEENLEDLVEVNGVEDVEMLAVAGLDFSRDGFEDAIYVAYAAGQELVQGDEIEFLGIEEDTEDYAGGNGIGLRELTSCDGEVGRDRTAPTAGITAVDGGDEILVEFSEPLADGGSDTGTWEDTLEDALDAGAGGATNFDCDNINSGNQFFSCKSDGDPVIDTNDDLNVDDDLDDSDNAWSFYDSAGNLMDGDGLTAYDNYATLVADASGGAVDAFTVECARLNGGGRRGEQWEDLSSGTLAVRVGTGFLDGVAKLTTDSGRIDIPLDGGDVQIVAQSSIPGIEANDWTFTVTHQRGLIRPTLSATEKAVTITIDKYVHSGEDIEWLINTSAIGKGGLSPTWLATSTADVLIDTAMLDEEIDTSMAGGNAEASYACLAKVTLEAPMSATLDDDSNPTVPGDIRLRVGGTDQVVTWSYDGVASGLNQAAIGGYVLYGLYETEDVGGIRLDIITGLMDDATAANETSDTVTTTVD